MRVRRFGWVALFVVAACSSSSSSGSKSQDKGVDPVGDQPGAGTENNPYGVAYPLQNQGYKPRAGDLPGNVIPNFKFLGHRGDLSALSTISLADLFDPEMRQYKLIHFVASARWCNPCVEEMKATLPVLPQLKEKKIIVIQALTEGATRGKGSTPADLLAWIKQFPIPTADLPVFLDPDVKTLGQFFDAAAIPWNADIDARTMELLSAGVGYSQKWIASSEQWLSWIDSHPTK